MQYTVYYKLVAASFWTALHMNYHDGFGLMRIVSAHIFFLKIFFSL